MAVRHKNVDKSKVRYEGLKETEKTWGKLQSLSMYFIVK